MAQTVWKGHLTFGLVSVPIRLYAAARSETVSFNQLHKPCGSRVKQKLFCPTCEKTVERSELVKGAEVEGGRFVLVEDSDLQAMAPESGTSMEVLEFVKLDEVDPVYFDTSYYMVAENKAGEKPYFLLQKSLQEMQYAAIAKLSKANKEHIVIVRPSGPGLMLHTLYYQDEVRQVADYGQNDGVTLSDKELELGKLFVSSLAGPYDPSKYHDSYRENLTNLIAAKAQGQTIAAATPAAPPPAMDLMAALKASLERTQQVSPVVDASVTAQAQ